jgi:hypothetical protein
MRQSLAISIEARAMDEIAVLACYIDTINLLIVYHRQHPVLLKRLIAMRKEFKGRLARAQARRAAAGKQI